MSFKLVANAPAGRHPRGTVITDPAEIERIMAGSLRKRFVKVAVAPGDEPHAPAAARKDTERAE